MNVTPGLLKVVTDGMTSQPSDDDVQMLRDFTGLDRPQAIVLLKKYPNLEVAAQHYFDDPIGALREEKNSRTWEPQDNIPYDDPPGAPLPPSPNSIENGRFIDLSPQHAQAAAQSRTEEEIEREDYERAIAASMDDYQGQKSGTTKNVSRPQQQQQQQQQTFGPAQRSYYDPKRWALAPIASSREIVTHPSPRLRRRQTNTPVLLRGSIDTDYLAPLLTIYHNIPLAREALLSPFFEPSSYAHHPEWWTGTTDETQELLDVQASTIDKDVAAFLSEVQRLMAFLDDSTRAYGSVDALADLRAFKDFRPDTPFSRFLQIWQRIAVHFSPENPLTQVFSTLAVKAPSVNGSPPISKYMVCNEGPVADSKTQGELLDQIVWNDHLNLPLDDICLERLGEIFTMRVSNNERSQSALDLEPSEVWYLDRYTPECRETIFDMRQRCLHTKSEITKLEVARHNLLYLPGTGPETTVNTILESAKAVLPLTGDTTNDQNEQNAATREALDQLILNLEHQIKSTEEQKLKLQDRIKHIMSDLSDPITSSRPLRRKYYLQGVSTKPSITYIRKPSADLVDISISDDTEDSSGWQWWRLAWETASQDPVPVLSSQEEEPPFTVQKVTIADVIQAVRTEQNSVVLVYASTLALERRPVPITPSLKQFVKQDNSVFEEELIQEQGQRTSRARTWSQGTESTARDEDDPFHDNAYPVGAREMTPMSMSTVRSANGQPSPKRPRGSSDTMTEVNLMDAPPDYNTIFNEKQQQQMQEKQDSKSGIFAPQALDGSSDHTVLKGG